MSRLREETIASALKHALSDRSLTGVDDTALIFHDLGHVRARLQELFDAFPSSTLHAIAVKANPLARLLAHLVEWGAGLEAATLPELLLAEDTGALPARIVFDSPCKTVAELEHALRSGCHVNVDSFEELERVEALLARSGARPTGTLGLRINPQVGAGDIAATSVAGERSKFGVPLGDMQLVERLTSCERLTGLHLHIGSQGCSVELLVEGVARVYELAQEVNERLRSSGSERRIDIFDVGGGLPVSYYRGREGASVSDYAARLRTRCPRLFTDDYRLITELGRYVHANAGWVAGRVEYVKRQGAARTAILHVGADLFLRECYRPADWHHELLVTSPDGTLASGGPTHRYTLAGPLCFAGDVIADDVELPAIEPGDYVVVLDAGAYTLSMWSRYNSRQIPKVLGYWGNEPRFELLRERESAEDAAGFWR